MSELSVPVAKRHQLFESELVDLAAGGGDEGTIAHLQAAERSRRLLLMRAVMDDLQRRAGFGRLPPPREQWQLLVDAQKRAPDAVDAVLAHPHVGAWAGSVLRRSRGLSPNSIPLWAELAYLAGLAAVAAVRAGLDFTGRLAVYQGAAVLPTLGFAMLDDGAEWGVTEIRSRSGRVTIGTSGNGVGLPEQPEQDAGNWFGLRHLQAEEAGLAYTLAFDDVDPYREPGRILPPRRVDSAALERWRQLFSTAWKQLVRYHGDDARSLSKGLGTVVPRPPVHRFKTSSSTSEESIGSAAISLPPDATTLAVTMLHEFQHSKLGALLHLAPMYEGDADERLYAPWRPDPRPVPSLLQGVYAFLGVTRFWRAQRHAVDGDRARFAHLEFAHWRGQTWRACQTLGTQPGLTDLGRRFVSGMGERLESWQAEPVPVDVMTMAEAIAADHQASWRIRHVHLEPADVETLADAWLDGRPQPALRLQETVSAAGRSTRHDSRSTLIRMRVADPAAFRHSLNAPAPDMISELVPGDIAYVTGDHAAAIRAYREQIESDPNRIGAWVGLGLALAAAGHRAPATALLRRPELVHAVYQEISIRKDTPPAPETIATWIGV